MIKNEYVKANRCKAVVCFPPDVMLLDHQSRIEELCQMEENQSNEETAEAIASEKKYHGQFHATQTPE